MIDTTPDRCARPGDVGAEIDGTAGSPEPLLAVAAEHDAAGRADAIERLAVAGLDRSRAR